MPGQTPPPPKASPGVPLGEEHDTPTGEHPVTKRELKTALNLNDVKTVVAMVIVAVGTVFGAYKVVLTEARAQSDAGVTIVDKKHEDLRREVERYQNKTDASIGEVQGQVRDVQKQVNSMQTEVQTDIRALYRHINTGRPESRLENPPARPDGGVP